MQGYAEVLQCARSIQFDQSDWLVVNQYAPGSRIAIRDLVTASGLGGRALEGEGSPLGVTTPEFIGQLYSDVTNPENVVPYKSTGLTNLDWELIVYTEPE